MIHTVRKGHYMRTLRPGQAANIPLIAVDYMGQIVVYCTEAQQGQAKVSHWWGLVVQCLKYWQYWNDVQCY